jgi:hypothetical protein
MPNKFLIVVGAGASKEFNLPIGNELKDQIGQSLNFRSENGSTFRLKSGDSLIADAMNLEAREPNSDYQLLWNAAGHIHQAIPQAQSIDNFIDGHAQNKYIELVAKLAITRSILKAERSSNLYINQQTKTTLDFPSLENVWLTKFFRILVENARIEDIPDRMRSVSMIVFNYDRCIEHFLTHALTNYYGITLGKAAELVEMMSIYHPYGTVGSLTYNGSSIYNGANHYDSRTQVIEYGNEPDPKLLLTLSRGIKTFTEGTDENHSDIIAIRRLVKETPTVLWLGFAFHLLNMKLLWSVPSVMEECNYIKQSFATAYFMSKYDTQKIAFELDQLMNVQSGDTTAPKAEVKNDLQCHQLFGEYTRGISLVN